ncbi:MAG: CRTAC1 family protein [Planctomycetaceae bacterium]
MTSSKTDATSSTSPTGAKFFVDVTAELGVDFARNVARPGDFFFPDVMGSGLAIFDYDNDGDLDLYFIQSGPPPGVTSDSSTGQAIDARNRLFRQEPDGAFRDATDESGLGDDGYGMGVAIGDLDNDGDLDVYVTNYGPDRLYQNNGDGTFTDIIAASGINNPRWGTSASFFDYDRDGWLDLFVVNYVDYNTSQSCTSLSRTGDDFCSPIHFPKTADRLFHNNGPQKEGQVTFTDVTVASGIASELGAGLGIVCADFTEDRYPDVYVANDLGPNFLWVNQQDGTFANEAVERGCAFNALGAPEASMGIALGDCDGDGDFDLFVTDLYYEANTLYLNQGQGYFEDATARSGLGPPSVPFTGFGTAWADLDNDGDLDAPVANRRVYRGELLPNAKLDPFWNDYAEANQLFMNDGAGAFEDRSAAAGDFTAEPNVARGLAIADLDSDGGVDVAIGNGAGKSRIYRNEIPGRGHWLSVRAVDPELKRDAIGAEIRVETSDKTLLQIVQPASSYLSSHDVRCHFGLGASLNYERIEVRWPDGLVEEFPGGEGDRNMAVTRGSGAAIDAPRPDDKPAAQPNR